MVCLGGVQRVHIVDGTVGTRMAREEDLSGIRKIIHPLEESGVLNVEDKVKETSYLVCSPRLQGVLD
nr:unnamed protein product [Digitaria exilis]